MKSRFLLTPFALLAVAISVFALPPLMQAGGFELPHMFAAGQPASAREVNENFSAVSTFLAELDLKIDQSTLEAGEGLDLVDGSLSLSRQGVASTHLASDEASLEQVSGGALMAAGGYAGAGTNSPAHPLDALSESVAAVRGVYAGTEDKAGVLGEASASDGMGVHGAAMSTRARGVYGAAVGNPPSETSEHCGVYGTVTWSSTTP